MKIITKLSSFQNLFLSKSFVAFFSLLMTLLFSSSSFGQSYTQVTTAGGLVDGVYLIVGDSTNDGMMINTAAATPYINFSSISNPGTTITTGATAANEFQVTVSGSVITIYNSSVGYVSYGRVGNTGNTANFYNGTVATSEQWTASVTSGLWTLSNVGTATRFLKWNSSSPRFACYTSGQVNLKFYKKDTVSPTVTTTAATSLSASGATFNGTVDANTLSTAITFEYGTTVSYGTSVSANPSSLNTDTATAVDATVTGLSVNTLYNYRTVGTVSGTPTNGNNITFYTLANIPSVVTVGNQQTTTLDVTISTTDGNPASTEYAIQETTGGLYVQADGSLGATAVWQTAATWATTAVTGLSSNTTYTFQAMARNGENVETAFGGTTSATTLAVQTVDYAVVQFPNTTQNILEGGSLTVYIRAYEGGLTTLSGAQANLFGWVGYSSTNDNPANTGWTWVPATFNAEYGNDDEYQATLSGLPIGTYYYAARFQIGTSPYVYGGSAGVWNNNNVTLNINADVVDYANVQFPTSGTINEGDSYTVYAQTYEPGTEAAGALAGITAWIGVSTSDTNPDTWTNWIPASFNAQSSNNDEYAANIATGLTSGTYYYASRFQKTGSSVYVYGGTNGSPWATSGVLTVNALAVPVATAGTNPLQTSFTANWDAVSGATSYVFDLSTTSNFITVGSNSVNEGFDAGFTAPAGWAFNSITNVYTSATNFGVAAPSVRLDATGDRIETPIVAGDATQLSFWIKGQGTDAITALLVEGFDGSAWTTIQNINPMPTVGTTYTFNAGSTPALPANIVQFRFTYTKSVGNLAFDDVAIAHETYSPNFVSGYENLNVGNVTTYPVTGLTENTPYFYRVRAVNGTAQSANSNTIAVTTKPTTVVWNAGWSNTTGPDQDIEASIEGPYNSGTDGEFTAKKVTVNVGGSVTIAADTNITVVNEVENTLTDADFVIESDGNLIQTNDVTNTGAITVQRMSAPIARLDYTLWSSPVSGQMLQAFSPGTVVTPISRFYSFDPTLTASGGGSGAYVSITAPATTFFAEGNGYLIRASNWQPTTATPWLGTFKGVPNNGNVSITTTSGLWYAIGNPYPSTIDADEFITSNSLTQPLYFWRKTNGASNPSYATYTLVGQTGVGTPNTAGGSTITPDGIIAAGQGFLTQAPSTSLVFTNALRNGDFSTQFLRSGSDNKSRVWLNLSNNEGFVNQMLVGYMTAATTGIDAAMDGRFFENNIPTQLSSLINGEEFAVQGRPEFTASDVVALGFKAQTEGNYTIAIDHVDGLFADGQEVFLKDNVTNTVHNLTNDSYSFTASAGASNARFEIVYQSSSTLVTENPVLNENTVVIYKQNQDLVVNTGSIEMKNVKVYDIQGRLLVEQKDINATTTKLTVGTNNQVLIVKVTSKDNAVVTKKVIN